MMKQRVLLVLLGLLSFSSCAVCDESSLSEVNSPDANYVATVFRRNCGATSALLYHVNVRKRGSSNPADHRGVIERGQVFLTDAGKVNIFWKDNRTLVVDCESCPPERKPIMNNAWEDVNIVFQLH